MASLMMYPIVIIAMIAALVVYYKRFGVLGSVVIVVTGCLGVYIGMAFSDVVLSVFGYEPGFPSSETGYYLYQGAIYMMMGVVLLSFYYALMKEQKELGKVFLFSSSVLLFTGVLDLVLDILFRIDLPILRLFIGLLLFGIMIFVFYKFKDRIFRKSEMKKTEIKSE